MCAEFGKWITCQAKERAVGFVESNEVELRRIAQLSDARFFTGTKLRFCDGGMLAERQHVLSRQAAHWQDRQNWKVVRAFEQLWAGERNSSQLCTEADEASSVVITAVLRLVRSMEHRLLSGGPSSAAGELAAAIEDVHSCGDPSNAAVVFESLLHAATTEAEAGLGSDRPVLPGALPAVHGDLAQAYERCLQIIRTAASQGGEGAARTAAILRFELGTGTLEELLADFAGATAPLMPRAGCEAPLEVLEPSGARVYTPGDVCTVRWRTAGADAAVTLSPQLQPIDRVDIKVCTGSADSNRLTLLRPSRHGIVARRAPAARGFFEWTIPTDFPCHGYVKLVVANSDDDSQNDQSTAIQIVPVAAPTAAHRAQRGQQLAAPAAGPPPATAPARDPLSPADPRRALAGHKAPAELCCPITMQLLMDPVFCLDGHTYERAAIEKWLSRNNKSPVTNEPMQQTVIPNFAMRRVIEAFIASVAPSTDATTAATAATAEPAEESAEDLAFRARYGVTAGLAAAAAGAPEELD